MAFAQGASAATYMVSNGNQSGAGSLYQAITDANAACAAGTDSAPLIQFSGPFVISPSFVLPPLPAFSCANTTPYNPTIDGWSTPGAATNSDPTGFNATLPVVVNMSSFMYGGYCVFDYSDNGYGGSLTVKGMEVSNYTYGGGGLAACGRVNLAGNRFANVGTGASIYEGSSVGGPGVADRNVIINNAYGAAIRIPNSFGAYNISNNLFGTPDGVNAAPNFSGIMATSSCCMSMSGSITGNVIVANGDAAIFLVGDTMTISGNKIGTDASGTNLLGSSGFGISLHYSYGASITNNVIAGAGTAISNVGDSCCQVSRNVYIYGNTIGNAIGNAQLANSLGIVESYTYGTRIDSNVISGNTNIGIALDSSTFPTITSNWIGTNSAGTAYPNGLGVGIDCTSSLTFSNNGVSANQYGGVELGAVQNSLISDNFIGTSRGNGGNGVEVFAASCGSVPSPLVVGMNDSNSNVFRDNRIAHNTGHGLWIDGGNNNQVLYGYYSANSGDGIRIESRYDAYGAVLSAATGNSISQAQIFGNGGKNINLGFDGGPLPNDPGDADTNKPNNWQNRPVIASSVQDSKAGTTTIAYSLDSKAGNYQIEFFSNSAPGKPAGEIYQASTTLTLAADGNTSSTFVLSGATLDNISATATRIGPEIPVVADTSEFADVVSSSALPVPAVTMSPTAVDFGDVVVGRSSPSALITILSSGTGDYVISALRDGTCAGPAICSSGAFVCSTTCVEGTAYRPSMSCSINASFAPTTLGPQGKTLAICDNAGPNKVIPLSGNGVVPPVVDIAYTPTIDSFGEVLVGTQGPPHHFRLTNSSANQVYLGPVSTTGDFVVLGNTCGATLAGGTACDTDVAFSPATKGGQNGRLQVTGSNAPLPPAALRAKATTPTTGLAVAQLLGSGVQYGDLRLPPSISLGTLVLRSDPRTAQLLLTNTGNGPLAISSITVAGPFTMTNDCGASLAPGASCSVVLKFNPSSLGTFSGTLTILSDAPGGSRAIALSAQVIADARPVVRVDPITIGFGARLIGSTSPTSRVTVTNDGSQAAVLGAMTFVQPEAGKSEYSISGTNCPTSLDPQASCFVDLVLRPLGFGSRIGQFIVPSNSADSPKIVNLGGTGCRPFTAGTNRAPHDPCAP